MTAPSCGHADAGACAVHLEPGPRPAELPLARVFERMQQEARPGSCATGRYRCSYYVWGSGPPLVFIPGMANGALCFAPVIPYLAEHFRCIAYDYPAGRGDGARLGRYRHADLVADLFALLDHLGVAQCYLLGFSFGSTIALAALRSRSERIARAILLGGFARRRLAPAEVLLARLLRHCWAPMHRMPFFRSSLRRSHSLPFDDRPADYWSFFVENSGAPAMAAVAHRALLLHAFDMTAELGEIRQPILAVSGDLDPLVGAPCTEVLREGLASATHVELTGCGHFATFTHPAVLADVVCRFLVPPCAAGTPSGA